MRFSKSDMSVDATQPVYLYEAPFHFLMASEDPALMNLQVPTGITRWGSLPDMSSIATTGWRGRSWLLRLICVPNWSSVQWCNHQTGLSNPFIPSVQENKGDSRAWVLAWAAGTAGHSESWRVMTAACMGPPVPILMGHWQQCSGTCRALASSPQHTGHPRWADLTVGCQHRVVGVCVPRLEPGASKRGNYVSKSHNSLLCLLLGQCCYASPFLQANCCLTVLS